MSDTACPICGADGVTACVGPSYGADHPGRPPYFDAQATAALDSMRRLQMHESPAQPSEED